MRRAALIGLAVSPLVLAAAACENQAPRVAFPVTFIARAEEPLAGVAILLEDRPLGTTDAHGLLHVALEGREGAVVPYRVVCPDGFRAPVEAPPLTLRRFTGLDPQATARGVEISVACSPAERLAALVVRAGRPGLPVLAQGREVARTGDAGVAHALVKLAPNTVFRVVVDTSAEPDLRPVSPTTTLTVPDADEIFVVDQAFVDVPPAATPRKRPPRKSPPKEPDGPERLKSVGRRR